MKLFFIFLKRAYNNTNMSAGMSKEMEFGGWHDINEDYRAWTLPKNGFSRVQNKENAVTGIDGKMLFVKECKTDNEVRVEKIDIYNWTDNAHARFLEVYGPQAEHTFRFVNWLAETHDPETVKRYKRMVMGIRD